MRLLIALLLVLVSWPSSAIDISNFKSGLACTHTKLTDEGSGWICQPTEDVLVTDQGSCVFNGVTKPCTWIGFEFDYKNAKKDTKLQCVVESSEPTDHGNPGELISNDATSQNYELPLDGESGHFFNPQYFIFNVRSKSNALLVNKGSCKEDGIIVFEFKFNMHFPIVGE